MNYILLVFVHCCAWISSLIIADEASRVPDDSEKHLGIAKEFDILQSSSLDNDLQNKNLIKRAIGNESLTSKKTDELAASKQFLTEIQTPTQPFLQQDYPATHNYENTFHYSYPPFKAQTTGSFYNPFIDLEISKNPKPCFEEKTLDEPAINDTALINLKLRNNKFNLTNPKETIRIWDIVSNYTNTVPFNGISYPESLLTSDHYSSVDFGRFGDKFFINPPAIRKNHFLSSLIPRSHNSYYQLSDSKNYPNLIFYPGFFSQYTTVPNLFLTKNVTSVTDEL